MAFGNSRGQYSRQQRILPRTIAVIATDIVLNITADIAADSVREHRSERCRGHPWQSCRGLENSRGYLRKVK